MIAEVKKITGYEDAIISLLMSKRSWTPEKDREIRALVHEQIDPYGVIKKAELTEELKKYLSLINKYGVKHTTLFRFINISIMTEGMHRGGQDDIDSHAERFDTRIIRSSTRTEVGKFEPWEMSSYYKGKIYPMTMALEYLGIDTPDVFFDDDGRKWVKRSNGYVLDEYKDNYDVIRGLYMESLPSNFISQISLYQWAHVYKLRGNTGNAHPEVKEWAESITKQIEDFCPFFTRELILSIEDNLVEKIPSPFPQNNVENSYTLGQTIDNIGEKIKDGINPALKAFAKREEKK